MTASQRRRRSDGPTRARPLSTAAVPFTAASRKRVKGVGRHAARHYDPITGRRREENAS